MSELIASTISLIIGFTMYRAFSKHLDPRLHSLLVLSLGMHAASAVAKVWLVFVYYRGVGDMGSYIQHAQVIADIIRMEPATWLGTYLRWTVVEGVSVPFVPAGGGMASRGMFMFATLHQLLFGPTAVGISLTVSMFSFAGKVGLLFAFLPHVPKQYHRRVAIACLLIPSAVFWSGAFSKETLLWAGCGWIPYGVHLVAFRGRTVRGVIIITLGTAVSLLFKPYAVIPTALGCGVWVYATIRGGRRRWSLPRRLIVTGLGGAIAFGGVLGVGKVFPRYDVANFAEASETLRDQGTEGGSYYRIDAGDSIPGQMLVAPLAIGTALYRPFLFEARNPLMLVNALETTYFLWLTAVLVFRRRLGLLRELFRNPNLQFCAVFVAVLAFAVGLSSTNLGTLSRYRMPLMPYFGMLFALLLPLRQRMPVRRGMHRRPRRGRGRGPIVPLRPAPSVSRRRLDR